MKHLFVILSLLSFRSFAQTQRDYEHTMGRFMKFYNSNQGDSIIHMWPEKEWDSEWMHKAWGTQYINELHEKYGKLLAYKYVGIDTEDDNPGWQFLKLNFSIAGWKTTSFNFDKGQLSTFRLITSSDGIDKLLKKTEKIKISCFFLTFRPAYMQQLLQQCSDTTD